MVGSSDPKQKTLNEAVLEALVHRTVPDGTLAAIARAKGLGLEELKDMIEGYRQTHRNSPLE